VWGRPVGPSCVHEARSVGRVPRSAQHAGVGGVERRATVHERGDVVERQVARRMRRMLGTIARADVAVLADVARDHPPRQPGPSWIRVDVMVGTDARQARMLGAATAGAAGDHTADRAQLHWARRRPAQRSTNAAAVPRLTLVTLPCRPLVITIIVSRGPAAVYSPAVLRPRGQPSERTGHPGAVRLSPDPCHASTVTASGGL